MDYIRGKVKIIIYESDSNYKVGVLKVKEATAEDMQEFVGKMIYLRVILAIYKLVKIMKCKEI